MRVGCGLDGPSHDLVAILNSDISRLKIPGVSRCLSS